jgi:hypothetical protein
MCALFTVEAAVRILRDLHDLRNLHDLHDLRNLHDLHNLHDLRITTVEKGLLLAQQLGTKPDQAARESSSRVLSPPTKNVSRFGAVLPISSLGYKTINTLHPNQGKPAAMLGRKASGPGLTRIAGLLEEIAREGSPARPARAYFASGNQHARRTLNAFPLPSVSLYGRATACPHRRGRPDVARVHASRHPRLG